MSRIFKDIKDNKLDIKLNNSEIVTVILDNDIDINYQLDNGEYKILIFNNANNSLKINEIGNINNSKVEINYIDLNNYDLIQNNKMFINENSSLTINSTYLGIKNKKIDFNLINSKRNSYVSISNNVVCLNNAQFNLNVVGEIVKGAKNSKCYQKSRCLTFENPKAAKVLPILKIDENDVEASHSLSSGTIDDDVLFYMNSRGLSKKESLSLLLVSYLMPNEDFYSQYEDGLNIKKIADGKVQEVCLI